MSEDELKDEAIKYWQDSLAKFFPTSPGPTNTEILMFKAGFKLSENKHQEERDLLDPYGF